MTTVYTSVTRISNLADREWVAAPLPRDLWAEGQYVVGEVVARPPRNRQAEVPGGRLVNVFEGDLLVGAFGVRYATLEAVGSWEDIGPDGLMEAMTPAGLMGRITSKSAFLGSPIHLRYVGHVHVLGGPLSMADDVPIEEPLPFTVPTVLVVGTSMSAGKTLSGELVVRQLVQAGFEVAAAKITGAARSRDFLSFADAGAAPVLDFIDAGLPSTVCPEPEFRARIASVLNRIQRSGAQVAVIEAGASPLEPYNGAAAVDLLSGATRFMLLAASDPYAVLGVMEAFGRKPDLVSGIAANTEAGRALVRELCGVEALDLLQEGSLPRLDELLGRTFGAITPRGTAPPPPR